MRAAVRVPVEHLGDALVDEAALVAGAEHLRRETGRAPRRPPRPAERASAFRRLTSDLGVEPDCIEIDESSVFFLLTV